MKIFNKHLTTILCLCFIHPVFAQKLSVTSKSASFIEQETTYLNTYFEDVVAKNLKINITGNIIKSLVDIETGNEINYDITGTPAVIVLKNDEGEEVTIVAEQIIYDVESDLLTATKSARVDWKENYIKGYKVVYKLDGTSSSCNNDPENKNSVCETSFTK